MKKLFAAFLFVIFAASAPAFPQGKLSPWNDPGFVGDLAYVKGDVQARRVKGAEWMNGYRNMPDYLFDQVKTGDESIAAIEFKDGSQVGINKNTTVLIDTNTSVKDVTQRTFFKRIILNLGAVWCKVTHQEANESFTVETRGGVLGIRGTEFIVSANPDGTMTVYLLEGDILTGPDADHLTGEIRGGQKVVVKAGTIISVSKVSMEEVRANFPGLDPGANIESSLLCEGISLNGSSSLPPSLDASRPFAPHLPASLAFESRSSFAGSDDAAGRGSSAAPVSVGVALKYGEYQTGDFLREIPFRNGAVRPSALAPTGEVKAFPPTFSWSAVPGAASYEVMVGKEPIGGKDPEHADLLWMTRVDQTSVVYPYTAPQLVPGETYYWAVDAVDENGVVVGARSDTASFAVGSAAAGEVFYPALVSPVNGTFAQGAQGWADAGLPVFRFQPLPSAARYQVLISSAMDGSDLDLHHLVAVLNTNTNAAAYDLASRPLEPERTYYWTVRALDQDGRVFADAAPPAWFKISADQIGARPIYPVQTASASAPIHMEWVNWIPAIHGFHLVVSASPNLDNPVLVQDTSDPWFDWSGAALQPGTTYYWRVTTVNLDGTPGTSGPTASFQVTQ